MSSKSSSQAKNHAEGVPPALATPTGFGANAVRDIAAALNLALADVFALYLKTKNFHWHMSGPHFRDYHLLLDEQSDQIFAMTDVLAERVRKIGGVTLHSIGEIARTQRILDNDAPFVEPQDMLDVYDEFKVDPAQVQAWKEDRRGALVGEALAKKLGWKVGDRVTLKGSIYPGDWEFHISGIYTATRASVDKSG